MTITEETVESIEWYLAAYSPQGIPTSDHLKLRRVPFSLSADSLPPGQLALETLWISVDPYLTTRMTGRNDGLYFQQFGIGEGITSFAIGRVVSSNDRSYKQGDIVVHPFLPVAEYCAVPAQSIIRRVDPAAGIDLPDFLSCFGIPGFAAWVGIEVVGNPKPESNVFVSAAAGAVGMFAGQLAKLKGCRVVGSCGSDDKAKLLKEEFGYDEAFNYKKENDFDAALTKYFPHGIDLYLDNVGGKMLEAVLNHVNLHAKIPICGQISQYNQIWSEREGVRNLVNVVGKEVQMQGYLVGSYLDRFAEFGKEMESYLKQGKIRTNHKIYHGLESFLESLGSLFTGSNIGKVMIQVKPGQP